MLPTDGQALLALDARTGRELWRLKLSNATAQLIGVANEQVVIVDKGLQVVERLSGKLVGRTPPTAVAGKAAIRIHDHHGEILWPSTSARGLINSYSLRDVDISYDGLFLPESGGANLILANDFLVAAGRSRLSVFRIQPQKTDLSTESTNSSNE